MHDRLIVLTPLMACLAVISASAAERYPVKPVRLLVGQEAGSALDNGVRIITPVLAQALSQQIIVDNRPGAGGMIALQIGLASATDGYTLINAGAPQMIAPYLFKKLPYDFLRDFAPVARLTSVHNVLVVTPALPAAHTRALIDLLKTRPGQFNMASAGVGSASHLAGVLFNAMAGVNAMHVPYKGGAAAVVALIGNEAQYLVTPLSATIGHIQAGRLRVLGAGGEARARQLPDVPTLDEAGLKGYRSTGWNGLFVKSGVPQAIVARLATALTVAYASPDLNERILRGGVEPALLGGAAFTAFMHDEMKRFGAAAKAAGLQPE
jgi:tripartite-type tricarboxylate transporter receptor subunit TctC